ncbi:MAG: pyridoxal-phosphate dependent enzyme [Chloroflexi bacterium]|nr:MAG: pyridoxal-phosphate dependent enzyme [Chloroflexota bacterium]
MLRHSAPRLRIYRCARCGARPRLAAGPPGHRISRRGLRAPSLRLCEVIAIERIRAAADRARKHVQRTPLVPVEGALLKLECLQPTGSFKVRGFFAAALGMPAETLRRGLITVSAGNAAQACAYAARTLGVSCRVVMYDTAPATKVEGVKRWGATPILMPREAMLEWLASEGWRSEPESFIHPFAEPEVIAGHGGLGLELLEDVPDLSRVLVPVGGGGLIGGIASALKAIRPGVEVIGVQSDGYALWTRCLAAGGPVTVKPETIADGTTAPFDARMFELLKECVDRWLTVPEPRLRTAIPELAAAAKVVAEGAGALAFAALEQLEPGPPTVAVVSGGNIDPKLLAQLLG